MIDIKEARNIETVCKCCNGTGVITYANTSTWRGGIGGSAMTTDICNRCWGTGDIDNKGVNLREYDMLKRFYEEHKENK